MVIAAHKTAPTFAFVAMALSGCSPAASTASTARDLDTAAVEAAIEAVPGVTDADVGLYNTGAPDAFGARISITVDSAGFDELGGVVGGAVDAIAADSGESSEYNFEVIAPDPGDASELIIIALVDYRDRLGLTVGSYLGSSLLLTHEELQEAAGS